MADSPRSWPPFVDKWVFPFLRNGHLRPVVIAIVGHFSVAIALPVLAAVRSGTQRDFSVVFVVAAVTWFPAFSEWWIDRRLGPVTACVVGAWAGAAVIAAWGLKSGVL